MTEISVSIVTLPKDKQDEYQAWLKKQVIEVPSDELLEIYERRVLTDFSYLRAEKYDSPENQKDLKLLQQTMNSKKVPRNIQNPNYDKLMKFYDQITETNDLDIAYEKIVELQTFLVGLGVIPAFEYKPVVYDPIFDVRCSENLSMYLNYLLTKVANKQKS